MERIRAFWQSGVIGKVVLSIAGVFGLLIVCCVGIFLIPTPARTTTAPTSTARVEVAVSTALPTDPPPVVPTVAPVPTEPPPDTPVPIPVPTAAPAPTPIPATPTPDSPEARYIAIAQAGVTIPSVRTADMPKGEWKADVVDNGSGPEITLTMPVGIGLSNEQLVRQAKRQIAQAVKALFDSDPKIARVSVTGTLPDGADGAELGVALIFVERAAYAAWDGLPDHLGNWRIAARYQ